MSPKLKRILQITVFLFLVGLIGALWFQQIGNHILVDTEVDGADSNGLLHDGVSLPSEDSVILRLMKAAGYGRRGARFVGKRGRIEIGLEEIFNLDEGEDGGAGNGEEDEYGYEYGYNDGSGNKGANVDGSLSSATGNAVKGTYQILGSFVKNVDFNLMGSYNAAQSGDAESSGNISESTIGTEAWAMATRGATEKRSGALLAGNTNNNWINNLGVSTAVSGNAFAQNIVIENDVEYEPLIGNFSAPILGPQSFIEVLLNAIYNIIANITGNASATSGSALAWGNYSSTNINSYLVAEAQSGQSGENALNQDLLEASLNGETPELGSDEALAGAGATLIEGLSVDKGNGQEANNNGGPSEEYSSGNGSFTGKKSVLEAQNSSEVGVENNGLASASSGPASAIGVLINNLIHTDLAMNFSFGVLKENSRANIVVNIIYNVIVDITGNARATSGRALALGNQSSTQVNSSSLAGAQSNTGNNGGDGGVGSKGTAQNASEVGVENNGEGSVLSGPASAIGVLIKNLIQTNLVMNFSFGALEENSYVKISVNIIYNLLANITGNAWATSGDAIAGGNSSETNVDNQAIAGASSAEGGNGPGGFGNLLALNMAGLQIENNGSAIANSGAVSAIGVLVGNPVYNAINFNFTLGGLDANENFDSTTSLIFTVYASLTGEATSVSGNALAQGNIATTNAQASSGASAVAQNQSDGSGTKHIDLSAENSDGLAVENTGQANAESGGAQAVGVEYQSFEDSGEHYSEPVTVDDHTSEIEFNENIDTSANSYSQSGNTEATGNNSEATVDDVSGAEASNVPPESTGISGDSGEVNQSPEAYQENQDDSYLEPVPDNAGDGADPSPTDGQNSSSSEQPLETST